MILSKEVEVTINPSNYKHYVKFYPSISFKDKIIVSIDNLSPSSTSIVNVECDFCGFKKAIKYSNYQSQTKTVNKYSCTSKTCVNEKIKLVCNLKYGVDNPFQADFVKEKSKVTSLEKYGEEHYSRTLEARSYMVVNTPFIFKAEEIKKTNIAKYGVDNPFKSKEIQEKIKEINIKNYGVDNPSKSEIVKERIKNSFLSRYGVENIMNLEFIKEKMKFIFLEKYGVDNPFKSKEIQDRIKSLNVEKYGVEYPLQSEQVRMKAIESNIRKYGVSSPLLSEEVRDKIKETNLIRYGHESASSSDEIKEKVRQTNIERYGVPYFAQTNEFINKFKNSIGIKHLGGQQYQTTYELDFLNYCSLHKIELSELIPRIEYQFEDSSHYYFPDYYIENLNLIIEVKSTYWWNQHKFKNESKRDTTLSLGYNYVLIMDKDYSDFNKYFNI